MGQQIKIFNKSIIDHSIDNVTITASDDEATNNGQDFVNFMRDRKDYSGWLTTGSSDSAACSLLFELGDPQTISTFILANHNLKAFTLELWDGIQWVLLHTATNETTDTIIIDFTEQSALKFRLTITGTQVADEDKFIRQVIITSPLGVDGQFQGFPEVKKPIQDFNKKISTMLSGKVNVVESIGAFETTLSVKNWQNDHDLTLVEAMYYNKEGFLVLMSGGDEDQFFSKRIGYRNKDFYFMRLIDDYSPEYYKSIYTSGLKITMKLKEAIS